MRCTRIAFRSPAFRALIALVVMASAEAAGQGPPLSSTTTRPITACTVRETSRTPLLVDGLREIYIEPTAVLPSRGGILFAGTPNYLYAPGFSEQFRDFVQDSVFGAVLGADGRARLVPAPIDPTRITGVRGVALDDGRWAVAFAELKNPRQGYVPDTIVRFWHGIYDGRAWSRIEQLPTPPGGEMKTAGASNLLVRGDTLFFAVRVLEPNGRFYIALFERRQGTWEVTLVRTDAAYVRLTYSDSAGLLLAVVRADVSMRRDGNSLFLHTREPGWATSRKIIQGHPEPVHDPIFSGSSDGPVLTWSVLLPTGGRQARAMIGAPDQGSPVLTLDSLVVRVAPVLGRSSAPLWVAEHLESPASSELRMVARDSGGTPTVVARTPNPYTGPFAAAATSVEEMILSGPLLRREAAHPSLVTLLIRARVECAPRAP